MTAALVLTTINVPTVLALYRKCDPNTHFYIIGDRKTPDADVCRFLEDIPNHSYYGYDFQVKLGYRSHEALGPDTLSRRNIGFLEALKHGADIVITIDDDNMPVNSDYFFDYVEILYSEFDGIKVSGKDGWFDPGQFLVPPVIQRGFPIQVKHRPKFEPVVNAKVGVASGLILGDSDMDAYTRIGKAPTVGDVAMLARTGCVVDPKTYTIFNSQNSAVLREFMPAFFMAPGCQRYDDVFGSLIVQRVMRERDYHVHLGPPFAMQERNQHDLLVDLRAEIDGMQNIHKMVALLDAVQLPLRSVVGDTRLIYEALQHTEWYPKHACTAAFAWLDDCREIGL